MKQKTLAIGVVIVLVCSVLFSTVRLPSVYATNSQAVVNGSFSTGTTSGWGGSANIGTSPVYTGCSYSAGLNPEAGLPQLWQSWTAVPVANIVSFGFAVTGSNVYYVYINFTGGVSERESLTSSGSWTTVDLTAYFGGYSSDSVDGITFQNFGFNSQICLDAVSLVYSSGPAPTPTPTPPPPLSGQAIVNGNFGTGTLTGWNTYGLCGISSTVTYGSAYSAWISNAVDDDGDIDQTINIGYNLTAYAITSFTVWLDTSTNIANDYMFDFYVSGTYYSVDLHPYFLQNGQWQEVNLLPILEANAGNNGTLVWFGFAIAQWAYTATLYIDDVSLTYNLDAPPPSGGLLPPTPVPTMTPAPTPTSSSSSSTSSNSTNPISKLWGGFVSTVSKLSSTLSSIWRKIPTLLQDLMTAFLVLAILLLFAAAANRRDKQNRRTSRPRIRVMEKIGTLLSSNFVKGNCSFL